MNFSDTYWACYRGIRDTFSPIYYRFFGHKFHIVRTSLIPQGWYDTDIRMLYAIMGLVEWYAEKDMNTYWTKEERVAEMARMAASKDVMPDQIESLKRQWENEDGIMEIYRWWKNYSNREKEIADALTAWHDYISKFRKDKDDFSGFLELLNNRDKIMSKEERKEEERLGDLLDDLEKKLYEEEQEMLKKAVELRASMWS